MRSRLLLNLVLLAAVVGLGLFFRFMPDEPAEPAIAISEIDISDVQVIRLERDGRDPVELKRAEDNWRLVKPFAMDADNNRAEGLLMLAAIASQQRFAASDLNLARYGLEPARTVLDLDGHQFVIGDEHPMQPQRYVRYEDYVHLVPDTLQRELLAPATYYANGKLLPTDEPPVRIVLPNRTLTRVDSEWQADPPLEHRSPNAVGNAWRTAYAMTVRQYEAANVDHYGEVIAEFEQAEPITLEIISPAPNVILARPALGVQYHLDSDQSVRLLLMHDGL